MNGFWGGRSERCFVDVRVFNPYAQSNVNSISAAYRRHENIKRRAYGQRVREVEHASFTPIVMSARGVRHLWKSRTLAQKSLEITTEIIGNQEIRLHARNLE